MGVCFGYDDGREPAVRGEARPARPGVSRACLLTAWKANRAPAGPRASSCSVSGEAGMRAAKQTAPDVGKHCLGPAEINSPGARAGAGAGGRGVAGNGGWGGSLSSPRVQLRWDGNGPSLKPLDAVVSVESATGAKATWGAACGRGVVWMFSPANDIAGQHAPKRHKRKLQKGNEKE